MSLEILIRAYGLVLRRQLPATAKRLEQGDQRRQASTPNVRQLVAGSIEQPLGIRHGEEVGIARRVFALGRDQNPPGLRDLFLKCRLLRREVRDVSQSVLNIREGSDQPNRHDDEHVAALGVYDDAIGAVFGFDARQNFEGLEVERYRLTCTAVISIALAPGR